jgi:predicted phage baseplate assembly protein
LGFDGNVEAGKLMLLASRPLGVRGVTIPAAATGAEDPEEVESARENAPLAVRTLDRIVSLADYQDFARGFAGIAKARGVQVWDGHSRLVHLTIAGFDGDPVETTSDLYKNLVEAIATQSDGIERVIVASHTPRTFALEATITVDEDYVLDDVLATATDEMTTAYSFDERELASPITEADVMTRLSALDGVVAVKVTRLHRMDQAVAAQAVIAAADATWDPVTRTVSPAELLTLVPANLRLTAVFPS